MQTTLDNRELWERNPLFARPDQVTELTVGAQGDLFALGIEAFHDVGRLEQKVRSSSKLSAADRDSLLAAIDAKRPRLRDAFLSAMNSQAAGDLDAADIALGEAGVVLAELCGYQEML